VNSKTSAENAEKLDWVYICRLQLYICMYLCKYINPKMSMRSVFNTGRIRKRIQPLSSTTQATLYITELPTYIYFTQIHELTMQMKFLQQHCNVLWPKKLTRWQDSNPGDSDLAHVYITLYTLAGIRTEDLLFLRWRLLHVYFYASSGKQF
jgi:hypothetical protein